MIEKAVTTRRRSSFFFSSRRRHTRLQGDWSSDVCSSDLQPESLLPVLSKSVEESLADVRRFEGHLRGSGFFPNARHARVGWVGARPEERSEERRVGKECRSRWSPYH